MVAATLAVVFGFVGVHKLYLGEYKHCTIYVLFSWTTVPFFLGLYDAYRYVRADDREFHQRYVGSGLDALRDDAAADGAARDDGTGAIDADDGEMYLVKATGQDGSVILYEDRVRITREGWMSSVAKPFEGDKDIPIDEVTSVQLKAPGKWWPGHIEIGESGHHELGPDADSENAVVFESGQYEEFKRLRHYIQKLRRRDGSEGDGATEMLDEMFAAGALTEEEYRERKRVLEGE